MKKSIKISLIVIVILLIITGGTIGGIYLYSKHEVNKSANDSSKTEETLKIEELAKIVYDSLPSQTEFDISLKNQYEGYEEFTIVYESSNEKYLTNSGIVTRNDKDHDVLLHYTISYKEETLSFSKTIIVLKNTNIDNMSVIVNSIRNQITSRMPNGFILPTVIEGYESAEIIWKADVINKETNEIEPTIHVNKIDGNYIVEFSKAEKEELCFLEAKIKYKNESITQRFMVYTKTSL